MLITATADFGAGFQSNNLGHFLNQCFSEQEIELWMNAVDKNKIFGEFTANKMPFRIHSLYLYSQPHYLSARG